MRFFIQKNPSDVNIHLFPLFISSSPSILQRRLFICLLLRRFPYSHILKLHSLHFILYDSLMVPHDFTSERLSFLSSITFLLFHIFIKKEMKILKASWMHKENSFKSLQKGNKNYFCPPSSFYKDLSFFFKDQIKFQQT